MEIEIKKLDHFGNGIGYINNKTIFVKRSLPNEIVDININVNKKNYANATIKEIKKKSSNRIEAICPYYDVCGGCNFLHTTYDIEKEFKINKAIELLGMCNNFYETKDLNYRNKVTLHIENNKIGYYEEKSNKIVPIISCFLLDNRINNIIKKLNEYLKDKSLNSKRVIIKVDNNKTFLDIDGNINNDFLEFFNDIDIIINKDKVLKGENTLEINLNDYKLCLGGNAFFQVNREGLNNIAYIINSYLKDKNYTNALDLYGGVGTWGILISKNVKKIITIEENIDASSYARKNKKINHIFNLEVINGKVEDYIASFNNIDLIITDPPRSGLDSKTREYLIKINPKSIIYISCDMQTLKRDLECLKEQYNIQEIDLVDMFKRTYHVESVVVLERI